MSHRMRIDTDDSSNSGYERDFMKQTMLEHDSVFKNQVHELHRLYRIQKNLVDGVKGNEDMNLNDHTVENASQRQLPGFLLANSMYGEGSSSRACNGYLQNGVGSKVRRKMIDLQLPADEYLDMDETADTDEITTICPPYKLSKSGTGDTSHWSSSSGSCLDLKNSNGLADLNEPLNWQESEPVALSRDMDSLYGRNNADVQSQWLEKHRSQNGWMFLEAGHDRSNRDQLHWSSHSVQVLSNSAFQPQSYPTTDYSKGKFSGERSYNELEVRSKNPQVSYGSHVESSVASNAPKLHNEYRPDFFRPWSHLSSSRENPMSSSHHKYFPDQTNPLMNFNTHARAESSFEMRSRVSNGHYQGFSSGSKEPFFNFSSASLKSNASLGEVVRSQRFESLQRPQKQEFSAGLLPWLKPKSRYKSEISNGCFDLNASANEFMDGTETEDDLTTASPQKGLRSVSCSTNANTGRVEMINPQSKKSFISHSLCTDDQQEENQLVKLDLDINLPCDASVSVDNHGAKAFCLHQKDGNKAANFRHYIDLNSCATEDDEGFNLHSSLKMETKATTWIDLEALPTMESEEEGESLQEKTNEETHGLMKGQDGNYMNELDEVAAQAIVAISLSDHPDDAACSSTDAAVKSSLSWFADVITSCGDKLENRVDGSQQAPDCEDYREDYSSGEIDYFEAKTLSLQLMKEEDYMPEPLVPEYLILEGAGFNQPRRGQARRGRPKRDFQRDILPGLSSLSRHEVTEDIQMFGGLTKAREYTWNSGVAARRNSKRKRLVSNVSRAPVRPPMAQEPMDESMSVAVGLEDTKITGWGKTTRRPRRQRCPPATVILT